MPSGANVKDTRNKILEEIRDAINGGAAGAFSEADFAAYESAASVSMASNTFTKIPISTKVKGDLGGVTDGDFIIPEAGFYRACGFVPHEGGSTNGHRRGGIYIDNNTSLIPAVDDGAMSSSGSAPPIESVDVQVFTCILELAAGQTVSLYGWQNSGEDRNVVAGAWLCVDRVGIPTGTPPIVNNQLPKMTTAERNAGAFTVGYSFFNLDTEEQQTLVTGGWYCHKKAALGYGSTTSITVNNNKANPSFVTGLQGNAVGFELTDISTGTFRNILGRNIQAMTGTISFQPFETGGGIGSLKIISERCPSNLDWTVQSNWVVNGTSLRPIEIPADGETFATKVSFLTNLDDGDYLRFRLVEDGPGGVLINSASDTILGQSVQSASVIFELIEQYTIDPII